MTRAPVPAIVAELAAALGCDPYGIADGLPSELRAALLAAALAHVAARPRRRVTPRPCSPAWTRPTSPRPGRPPVRPSR